MDCLSIWIPRFVLGSAVKAPAKILSAARPWYCSKSSSGEGKVMLQKAIVSEWYTEVVSTYGPSRTIILSITWILIGRIRAPGDTEMVTTPSGS